MTDLSKAISNPSGVLDLFSNPQDGEILTNSVEKSQDEIQNVLPSIEPKDPKAFISLLTDVVTKKANSQKTEQNSIQIMDENQQVSEDSLSPTIDLEPETLEEKSEEQSTSEMENNVAVSWINSQYYQHEMKMNQINTEQESNSIDVVNRNVTVEQNEEKTEFKMEQLKEIQVQPNEEQRVLEGILTQDQQQPEAVIKDKNNLLHDAASIHNPDSQHIIENTSLNLLETAKNNKKYPNSPASPAKSIESKELFVPQLSSSENKGREKETSPTRLFQPLLIEIENQKENATTFPLPTVISENTDGVKSLPMDNPLDNILTHETHMSAPMENHIPNLGTAPKALTIPIEINKPEWAKQFSDHIIWLGQHEVKSALIKINPEDLGPLEISIKVINDSASINITTHSHQIRAIIDQSLPKLQAMMAEQGLNLSEVHIDSDDSTRQSSQQNSSSQEEATLAVEDEKGITPLKNKKAPKGLVDYFA
ncbi:flagellar hook-length control protein FliK [Legionella anisa]|uniref:Flagellar hook-length control protein FliK n=1 Tax=Legionella anisa TaxID=28082 RepID=A0AAX0WUW6_9GAMM|nr:flagellar hook-length control protein FliK [Legionella anisa]AWN74354.1 flagellar hook-length control protein FliK [Legionella anisa]KTC71966.1 putative flagellar hook-length control protein [Legionella anisa]MBN5935236.1 flagellar hook-length control protein FliK [Legionella anisa]MCW8425548.1 flagellar hook-length control protein FliK [Legionella anisa]MCW8449021.1 flagellar hook-length control protein FliK [Legionella anisa]